MNKKLKKQIINMIEEYWDEMIKLDCSKWVINNFSLGLVATLYNPKYIEENMVD